MDKESGEGRSGASSENKQLRRHGENNGQDWQPITVDDTSNRDVKQQDITNNTVVANTSTTSVLQARNNNNSGGTIKSTHQCIDNHHNIKDNNITLNQQNVGRDEECSSPYTSNARASRLLTTDVQQPTVTNKQPVADHCYIRTNTDEQAGT